MTYVTDDEIADAAISGMLGANLVRLADVSAERIDWLWPGYIARGKLHVVDGDPGLGKSTMSLDLAARITTGKPWPDGQVGTTPAGVVLLSAEDGLGDTIRPRLDAAGADVTRVHAMTGVPVFDVETGETYERMPALPTDIKRIRQAVEHVNGALLVIDPLMAYLGADVNSHRDQDVRRALAPLAKMAEQTRCAVWLVRHLSKGGGMGNAVYRGGGSIGIIGAARLGFAVARDPQDEHRVIVAATKANITARPASLAYVLVESYEHGCARVEWQDGPVNLTADELLGATSETADERADRSEAADWLTSYLVDNGGEAEAAAVYKAGERVGHSKDALKRAKRSAGVASRKESFDAGWMWVIDLEGSADGPDPANSATKGAEAAPALTSKGAPDDRRERREQGSTPFAQGSTSPESLLPSLPSLPSRSDGVRDALPSALPSTCRVCGHPLDPALAAAGMTDHPGCDPWDAS